MRVKEGWGTLYPRNGSPPGGGGGGGDTLNQRGTLYPRIYCPGGQYILGYNVRGDIFSRGTAIPPTTVCLCQNAFTSESSRRKTGSATKRRIARRRNTGLIRNVRRSVKAYYDQNRELILASKQAQYQANPKEKKSYEVGV